MVREHHGLGSMNLSKLWEKGKDRRAWYAAVHGSQRVRHELATEQQEQVSGLNVATAAVYN